MGNSIEMVREKIKANMPKAAPSNLTWKKLSNYTLISECGRFTLGKTSVEGVIRYEAWMGTVPLAFRLESADAAKLLCESHAHNLAKEPVENTSPAVVQKRSKVEQVA
jgi:hypothetical protein